MNLLNIIDSIRKEISELRKIPICIYIGVGSAGHMLDKDIESKSNEQNNDLYYHQYPKCIETINKSLPTSPRGDPSCIFFHILIDPMLESPPFITVDKTKISEFYLDEDNIYRSIDNRHIVYCLRESVSMACYKSNNLIDITDELHILNKLAIDENILLVYNDFTGRSVRPLAYYFDPTISNNLDHIIYGIGNRCDFGCYIDLLHPTTQFAFILEKNERRDIVKIFNIYHLAFNKLDMEYIVSKYPLEQLEIIASSIDAVMNDTIDYFTNHVFYNLRIVSDLLNNKIKLEDINKYMIDHLLDTVPSYKHIFIEGDYTLYFDKQLEFYASYLNIIIYVKKIDIDGISLMKIITSDSNTYNWTTNFKNIIHI
jgi:hypothetical protein